MAVIDGLRGVAQLGILTMNITLGQPGATRLNPLISAGFDGVNFAAWIAGYFLFDEKMITLFSMLFGAGIVLFSMRLEHRGVAPAHLFYRRSVTLLLIGLVWLSQFRFGPVEWIWRSFTYGRTQNAS